MLRTTTHTRLTAAAALALATLVTPAFADDNDSPGRGVARISLLQGDVSVRRGDSGEWVAAAPNAPLVVQDRLLTGANSRAELQFDYANLIRLAPNAELRLAELEYRRYILQLASGTATFTVLRNSEADVEISTPAVAVRPVKRGVYRVTILPDGTSEVTVRSGEVEVFTTNGSERLKSGRTLLARGTSPDIEFQVIGAIPKDEFDDWNERRNRDLERSNSYRYVPSSVYGAEDLDYHGSWVYDPPYGHVWVPNASPGWAPYRHGRWSWIDWYGWSWVSYDPWGWAPYHYGRWYWGSRGWCWWPGAMSARHYWSPGLVAWVGFGRVGVGVGFGNVGWVPLAPYEPYHRWYGWGSYRGYGNRNYVDNSVNIVNNVNITNIYRNSRVNNGITAVNASDFTAGRFNNVVRVNDNDLRGANLVRGHLPVTPERANLRLADRELTSQPRSREDSRFFSRRTPSNPERVSFEDQRRGVEEMSRRTFGDRNAANNPDRPGRAEAAAANVPGASPNPSGRGMDSLNRESNRRSTEPPAENRGWRRLGESRSTTSAPNNPDANANSAPGISPTPRSSDSNGGWRRFGEPRTNRSTDPNSNSNSNRSITSRSSRSPEATAPSTPNEPNNSNSNRSWRRFGEPSGSSPEASRPSRRETPSNPSAAPAPDASRSRSSDNWRRFERTERPSSDSGSTPRSEGGFNRRREASPPPSSPAPSQDSAPPRSSPRFERRSPESNRGESLNLSPPIVRERRSNFESGSYSAPRFEGRSSRMESSPRFESRGSSGPSGSSRMGGGNAPRSSGSGGGGGFSGGRSMGGRGR